MDESEEWAIDFDQAISVKVEVFKALGKATMSLESVEGEIGAWDIDPFPVDDFMDSGLNKVGPWLNRRGLAYTAWQEPEPDQHVAVVYRYDGPEVDPRVLARRSAND